MELPAEEVADGRELPDGLGRADLPLALEVVLRLLRADLRHGDQADLGILRRQGFQVAVVGLRDRHSMFDWPEQIQTSPTSTSSNVTVFLPSTVKRVRPAGGHRVERDRPLAVGAGLGRLDLAGDRDRDLLARLGLAPDAVLLVALEDHVAAEDRRQLHVAPRGAVGLDQYDRGQYQAGKAGRFQERMTAHG